MMDFFDRQERARRQTKWLVGYFLAGVVVLVVAVYVAVLVVFTGVTLGRGRHHHELETLEQPALWRPQLFAGVAIGTLAVIGLGTIFKTLELSRGGSAVASMLGGRPVNPATTVPEERKLLNVVEEMAIASGVPVPQVYVLPDEPGINAFAAGHSTSDAVVAVTAGSLKLLSRDELQGVIGHEFSHILNGDMRLNLRLMGLIFGILCLAIIGRVLAQTRGGRSGRDRNALALVGLALLAIGWVGVFFGRLIQAAVSREREFLADASALQFTRNPDGLSSALQKIGRYSFGSHIESAQAEQASHLFFSNGMGEPMLRLLATHPPIADRIRAIDPAWDGKFPPLTKDQIELVHEAAMAELDRHSPPESVFDDVLGVPGLTAVKMSEPEPVAAAATVVESARIPPPPSITARRLVGTAGTPTTAHLHYAAEVRNTIPATLQVAARGGLGAGTLVYALLLSEDDGVRGKQLRELAQIATPMVSEETVRILPEVKAVATRAKLPLVDLALPGLRQMSAGQYQQFRAAVQRLVECDGQIDLFEYVLQKIVLRHLDPVFAGARKPVVQYYALKPLAHDCEVLLSALAYVGQEDAEKVAAAFSAGAQMLGYFAQTELRLVAAAECDLTQVDAALNRLVQAVPQIKKNVLDACAETVAADGVILEFEAEMLRAVADALDCPLPVVLG